MAAYLPPLTPEQLGDPQFLRDHGLKYPYMTGAMANGIGSVEVVESMSRAGMLGSFGAAGLSLDRIGQAIDRLQADLGTSPFCVNLIHSPNEPAHEMATAELLLGKGVRLVEASAYLDLTPAIVRYKVSSPANRTIAKVSRVEVATKFLSPPAERILKGLISAGHISEQQAMAAAKRPVADDITVEADSGGHTDNRPAITLLPTIIALRDRLQEQFQYASHAAGWAGGRNRDARERGGGIRDGSGLCGHRQREPGVRRVGQFGRGPQDAGRSGTGRCDDGPRCGHVRDGREGAGAQARDDVRDAGRQALRTLSGPSQLGSNPGGRACPG